MAIPSGTAPSSEQTSKVVGLIEGILRPDAAAKEQASLQVGVGRRGEEERGGWGERVVYS